MKKILVILLLLSALGLFDAGYLTYEHYSQVIPPCSLHAWFSDCGAVLTSKYATVFGIPVAGFGVLYYVSLFVLSFLIYWKNKKILLRMLSILVSIGSIIALYFISIQLFVLHAVCPYCMLTDINCLVLAILVLWGGAFQPGSRNTQYIND